MAVIKGTCDKHRSEGDEQAMNFCTDALPQELHSLADNSLSGSEGGKH